MKQLKMSTEICIPKVMDMQKKELQRQIVVVHVKTYLRILFLWVSLLL